MSYKFNQDEENRIFSLVEKLIGTSKLAGERPALFLNNIKRRMLSVGAKDFNQYIDFVKKNELEFKIMVSSLTIHTTYWFREKPHYRSIASIIENSEELKNRSIKVLSLPCSTGIEVYSFALVFEEIRSRIKTFDYEIKGVDVDSVVLEQAKNAIYLDDDLKKIPEIYHKWIKIEEGGSLTLDKQILDRCFFEIGNVLKLSSEEVFDFVICRNLLIYFDKDQIQIVTKNLSKATKTNGYLVFGMNEYIDEKHINVKNIGDNVYQKKPQLNDYNNKNLSNNLIIKEKKDIIFVGMSQSEEDYIKNFFGNQINYIFVKTKKDADQYFIQYNFRTILVNLDSDFDKKDSIHLWMKKKNDEDISVVCAIIKNEDKKNLFSIYQKCSDVFYKEFLFEHKKDCLIRIKSFLHECNGKGEYQLPILGVFNDQEKAKRINDIICSFGFHLKSFFSKKDSLEFLKNNQIQYAIVNLENNENCLDLMKEITKKNPQISVSVFLEESDLSMIKNNQIQVLLNDFSDKKICHMIQAGINRRYMGLYSETIKNTDYDLILIGGSTGGPAAFHSILSDLGSSLPPIVFVQHIPENHHTKFAQNLSQAAQMSFVSVGQRTLLQKGHIYTSEAGKHIVISEKNNILYADPNDTPPYKGHKPCVNLLFSSGSKIKNSKILAILLTGMGDDGASGLKDLYDHGAFTIAQEQTSSVVFGMPKVAIDLNGTRLIADLAEIRNILLSLKKT